MNIEKLSLKNMKAMAALMVEFWPESSFDEEYKYALMILNSNKKTAFLYKISEQYVGFIYLTLRSDFVEGATQNPVGYVEAIYLKPDFRRKGIGKVLLEKGESWARLKGCTQLASDAEITNENSIRFHKKSGFTEANRVVCFINDI